MKQFAHCQEKATIVENCGERNRNPPEGAGLPSNAGSINKGR
jgi:hypothetical protein